VIEDGKTGVIEELALAQLFAGMSNLHRSLGAVEV